MHFTLTINSQYLERDKVTQIICSFDGVQLYWGAGAWDKLYNIASDGREEWLQAFHRGLCIRTQYTFSVFHVSLPETL